MEVCTCISRSWPGSRLSSGALLHGACGKPLKCACGIVAVTLGADGPECRNCSPIFSDGFFSDSFDLERGFFDSFVYYAGGKRITDLLPRAPDFSNADYYFDRDNVVIELKTLTTEFAATATHQRKFAQLARDWLADGRLSHRAFAGLEPLPESFVLAHMRLIREQLESVTKKANKQIKETKAKLSLSGSPGLLLVMNDGFYQANPNLVLALIGDPLTRQMRSIDGYVLLNLRKRVSIPGDEFPRLFWLPKYRDADNVRLSDFVNKLGALWFRYLQELSGRSFESHVSSYDPDFKEMTQAIYV